MNARPLVGQWEPPGDKSLSHRALIFAAILGSPTELFHLNPGDDVFSTASVLRALGVSIRRRGDHWEVRRESDFRKPARALPCGNSGTTMRLMAGVLAALPFASTLKGDRSLSARPMGRIADPLEHLGARVTGMNRDQRLYPPIHVAGGKLRGGSWTSPVASAQVKSAALLAGLVARVPIRVTEPERSRDHTERMIAALGGNIQVARKGTANVVAWRPGSDLESPAGRVPGDPSAAAFFAAAAAAIRGSEVTLTGVTLNPTRLGFFRALRRMGAQVSWKKDSSWCGEPVGTLHVRAGKLRSIRVTGAQIPALIDEVPVLAVLAAGACRGETRIVGAQELRVKETDRLSGLADGLRALGADITERPDGLTIRGGQLRGGTVEARGDHRLAMAFRIAALLANGRVRVKGADVARVSHPQFESDLKRFQRGGRS